MATPPGTLPGVISLVVVDGCRLFSDALACQLAAESDLRVLYSATSEHALKQAIAHSRVDVVVCDAALFDSATLGRRPGSAEPAVVLLAEAGDRHRLGPAFRGGVRGWVPRAASVTDLVSAIRVASTGGTWVPPQVLTDLVDDLLGAEPPSDAGQQVLSGLTGREREVLSCLADGLSRGEVAARLHLSTNTVRTHVHNILSKLGVNSSVAAVALDRRARQPARGYRP